MADVDVEAAVQRVLQRAHRRFDAAMDELVPPTPGELARRTVPAAGTLGQMLEPMARSLQQGLDAFAAGIASLISSLFTAEEDPS